MSPSPSNPPKHILILGSGVFGLSTALALSSRPYFSASRITLVDQFTPQESNSIDPNPSASSIDTSRIIRADYASEPYARLAVAAQKLWRDDGAEGWGGQGRYTQNGLLLTTNPDQQEYVRRSLANVRTLAREGQIEEANGREEIDRLMGGHGISNGSWGYLNRGSGWVDAEATVRWAMTKIDQGRVEIRKGLVQGLLSSEKRNVIEGAQMADGSKITADMSVLAMGAWSPSMVDLRHHASATGQILGYIEVSAEERKTLQKLPSIFNMSTGLFVMPPSGHLLKVARHAFGYQNPQKIKGVLGSDEEIEVSVPEAGIAVPAEGQQDFRGLLQQLFPPGSGIHAIANRPFAKTRVCWYTDTPTGDFLIDYHPGYNRTLFLATGGSGHAFKFFPVLREKIVDRLEGCLNEDLQTLWRWREDWSGDEVWHTEDGSRGGKRGMVLEQERMKVITIA